MGTRALLAALCLAVGALPTAAPLRAQAPSRTSAAWVSDSSIRPSWSGGLWHATPGSPDLEKILGRRWRPLAPSVLGPIAVVPSDSDGRAHYWIVHPNGKAIRLPHATEGPACASWSGDGRLLAYVEAESADALGTVGTLWVSSKEAPLEPTAVATGRFPECPAWSPQGRQLAYFEDGAKDRWDLYVFDGTASEKIAATHHAVGQGAATKHRSFDWAPEGVLAWIGGRSIHSWDGGVADRLTQRGALTPVIRRSEGHDWRTLRFSPNGKLIGTGVGYGAAIFTAEGVQVNLARGNFRGWAGNYGILTARTYRGVPSLLLYRALADAGPKRIQKYSKQAVVTDPEGNWFAFLNRLVDKLEFHRPDGDIIRKVSVARLRPWTPGAVGAGGRFSVPPWP
jgi:hypothetical protein